MTGLYAPRIRPRALAVTFRPRLLLSGWLLVIIGLLLPRLGLADSGLYKDFVTLRVAGGSGGPAAPTPGSYRYYANQATAGTTPLGGAELGSFNPALGATLRLDGAEVNTYQLGSGDVNMVGAQVYYRLYPASAAPTGNFQSLSLPFAQAGLDGTASNKQWLAQGAGVDLLALAPQPGRYVLDVFFAAQGTYQTNNFTNYDNRDGANYRATFTVLPAAEGLVADSTELGALRAFYASTGGPQWANHAGWPAGDSAWARATLAQAAHWPGLGVSGGDVTSIYLINNNLQGTLPARLGELQGLTSITFGLCGGLSGPLPASLGRLTRLTHLQATVTGLSGPLPADLAQLRQLRELQLNSNQFSGALPAGLGSLTNLQRLDLNTNRFTGPIPPELGQLAQLTYLSLDNDNAITLDQGNRFTGGIPRELGQLTNLTSLALDMNPLGGTIPPELGNLQQLEFLELDDAHLSGAVPAAVMGLPHLTTLILGAQNQHYHDPNTFSDLPPASVLAHPADLFLQLPFNQFGFAALESYFASPGQLRTAPIPAYYPQISPYLPQTQPAQASQYINVGAGQPLQLASGQGGARTAYQWQRQAGAAWTSLPADTLASLRRAATVATDAGTYRCQMTNRWVTGLTLTSPVYTVTVLEAGGRNLPDDTNRGLALAAPAPAPDAQAPTPADVNYVRTWVPRVALTQVDSAAASAKPVPGVLVREQWDGVPGAAVAAIPRNSPPTRQNYLSALEAPANVGDNYGARIRGYVLAPATGSYTFWLASDDQAELWLSPDADSTHKRLLAHVSDWTYPHEYTRNPSEQQSAPVALVAGQRYYLEVLHKQGVGGDHLSVAWRRPLAAGGGSLYQDPVPGQALLPLALPTQGVLLREQWDNFLGDSLRQLPLMQAPSSWQYLTLLEAPTGLGEHYGARLRGVVVPPQTGTYTFWLASDDEGELWLSPDADPAHLVRRAWVSSYTDPHQYNKLPGQQVDVFLQAGQRYALQVLHRQGTGGDHVSVAWRWPDGTYQAPVPGQYLAPPAAAGAAPVAATTGEPAWTVDQARITTQYLDGLGRPVQTVLHQASPSKLFDLVQPQAYDGLGREPRQYLPYPDSAGTSPGRYRPRALTRQADFYYRTAPAGGGAGPLGPGDPTRGVARTGAAFAETQFEASPLNRVLAQGAAGEAWQLSQGQVLPTSHVQQRLERPNAAADSVPRFIPNYDPRSLDPGYQGLYADGELWGTLVNDEQGHQSIEWKDKLGQVVCKQVEAGSTGSGSTRQRRWLRTAYAYDDFSRLRFVLQPEATKRVLAQFGAQAGALPAAAQPYLFHYRYDGRGRQVAKQVPGQDTETLVVYDPLDRPVLSQDAQQHTRREWSWSKYDALGRVVLTGLVTRLDTLGQVSLQNLAAADTVTSHQYEQRTADKASYPQFYTTRQAFPRLGAAGQQGFAEGLVLTASYYDDYDFDNDGQADADGHYTTVCDAAFAAGQAPVADEARVTGLPTRSQTRVLGVAEHDAQQAAWLVSTSFYDERGRVVQVQSTNARGGQDVVSTQLDFLGKPLRSVSRHQGPHLPEPLQVVENMRYDHAERLLATTQQLPGEAVPVPLSRRAYNELGQLLTDTLAAGRLRQLVDYAYNIRGWLTSLNDPYAPATDPTDLFHLSLHYEQGFTKGYEQYNGNLTGQTWRGRDGVQRAYGYVYDPLNRILQGDYVARAGGRAGTLATATPWNQEADHYRLSFVSYDDNGNILTLRRQGLLQAATHNRVKQYGAVDNLTYAYQGNRLQAVDDAVSGNQLPQPATYHGAPTSLAGDFQEGGVQQGQEYLYDANGNLTQDKNKGITGILYNHLNLPRQIHFGQVGDSVVFRYSAAGQKVAKLVYQTGKPAQRTDYLGPYQYEGDSLRFFPHAAGRVLRFVSRDPAGQATVSYQREYTIKDHLGNLRLAYRAGQRRRYLATLEQDSVTHRRETQQFDSLSVSTPIAVSTTYSYGGGSWAAKLNAGGSQPQPLGPLTQLAVQRGDTLKVSVAGLYPQKVTNSTAFSLLAFVANLLQPGPGNAPASVEAGKRGGLPLLQIGLSAGLASIPQLSGGVPKGYLRVLLFNADSVLVRQSQWQLSQNALGNFEVLGDTVRVNTDGYVSVYVGNESNVDVFFDQLAVEHRPGLQVQETQYESWGVSLAGVNYSSPGIKALNQYQFNSKERQNDLGLGWSDYGARYYDPARGPVWFGVDPLADKMRRWSPYTFSFDNAIRFIDPDGMKPLDNYIFNEKGNYVRTDKNSKPDALVIENSKTGKQQSYQFNDPENDVLAIKNGIAGKGGITKVEKLSDAKVEKMINESGVKTAEARQHPLLYAWREGANKMDYGATSIGTHDLNAKTFYIREGVAYNVGDMGNYLFGRGAAELGISVETAQAGGQVNNMLFGRTQKTPLYTFGPGTNGSPAFFDSPGDQKAIYNGHTNSPVGAAMQQKAQQVQEMNNKYGPKF